MTGLSPQTQAVLDAFSKDEGGVYLEDDPERLSFAICELVDQVLPNPCQYPRDDYMEGVRYSNHHVRTAILAIATELKTL